ncbi:hypothetical protein [Thermochromatium tepidum]|uniref:DUF3761 domain-containing protein n=1 Tax=Thermochromatium tepidum ATCC 43061 TaxID=316276 RepID=A0A6I6DZV7_THETI|nr:hypothetical protein [Thermochromatium tepidum]QGU32225.1 hypothetical protein E6P07_04015 [Thermochromatium tepidum ATCC 43061]
MRRFTLVFQLLAAWSILLLADPVWSDPKPHPMIKYGRCPSSYRVSGDYCVPSSRSAFAVEKRGRCPSGYFVSGDYCVAGSRARMAIPKVGRCPSGWTVSGDYCLERR